MSDGLEGTPIATLRRTYKRYELSEDQVPAQPLPLLQTWLAQALEAKLLEPYAMSVATANASSVPSSRIVLLRALDERGLVFFTSYLSRKGREIAENPNAAALFYWAELEREVRVEGTVEEVSEDESDAYFASRPRGHQLSAWASEQSEPVESQALLLQRVEDYRSRFEDGDVPRPHSWGGYLIRPSRIEFWQGRENRLHDRLEFRKNGSTWRLKRLSP
ncbi:MAG: pyridoxamine 5'-phosphate oxidase [Candidatus Eremiobacteraeota bacterium]|nr:pyridoxamine 5'-phosphate oxidase [Candidatus Eremiobacteraeota bacterium]